MNDILIGQWYRFRSQSDKHDWIMSAKHKYGVYIHESIMSKALLSITKNEDDTYQIRYRTNDHAQYDGATAVTWEPDFVTFVDEIHSITKPNIKRSKDMNIGQLIDKAQTVEINITRTENEEKLWVFKKSTLAGKILLRTIEDLNSLPTVSVTFKDLFVDAMMTDDEHDAYIKMEVSLDTAANNIGAKYNELIALMSITETYEQKIALLTQFGVLKWTGGDDVTQ